MMKLTPSTKAHSVLNPILYAHRDEQTRGPLFWLKVVVGTPVPVFMFLYSLSLLTSMSGMEFFGWGASVLTILYIALDLADKNRESRPFMIGVDISLAAFLIFAILGLKFNAPNADLFAELGSLRWILLLYLLSWTLAYFPGINRYFWLIIGAGTIIAGYGIVQHFTGVDLRYELGLRSESAVTPAPFSGSDVYQSVGLMSHHLTYGYLFSMVFCFPLAAFLLGRTRGSGFRFLMGISTIIIGVSLIWTYGRGVWIATLASILFMGAYVSRKALFVILILAAIVGGTLYSSNHGFRERVDSIWANDNTSNNDRKDLWRANVAMFKEHPWIGVGQHQNEIRIQEYFQKLGIENSFGGHAHNTYLNLLSTTGFFGFASFMLFIIGFLLMTHRLWTEVPKSHYWHRVFVLGALGSQISMHAGGLTQWNFGDAEVNHFFIFVLATVGYMFERYSQGVVPDDHCL